MWTGVADDDIDVLSTRRLRLVPMSCELMQLIIAMHWRQVDEMLATTFPQEWREDGWTWLGDRLADGARDSRSLVWGTRLARLPTADPSQEQPVVAEVGFHGPPDSSGWVEIGYRVVAGCRRQGFAEEAVSALLVWAGHCDVVGVKASVDPENVPSITLLRKLSFIESGAYRHEALGEQLIFRRDSTIW